VIGPRGAPLGYTIGNDVTARDIEAANPLYLPQAKVFRGGCALGPILLVAEEGVQPYDWTIALRVFRAGGLLYEGQVPVRRMRRRLDLLLRYLLKGQRAAARDGPVDRDRGRPPDDFTLRHGDVVEISIGPLGSLTNPTCQLKEGADARS
jgi:2-dehydro-3-deoxy-D-arabinonate dehydratase